MSDYTANCSLGPVHLDPMRLHHVLTLLSHSVGDLCRIKIEVKFKEMAADFDSWHEFSVFVNENSFLGDPKQVELSVSSPLGAKEREYRSVSFKEDFCHLFVKGGDQRNVALTFKRLKHEIRKFRPFYASFRPLMYLFSTIALLTVEVFITAFLTIAGIPAVATAFSVLALPGTVLFFVYAGTSGLVFPHTRISLGNNRTLK